MNEPRITPYPQASSPTMDPKHIASSWLDSFADCLYRNDVEGVVSAFQPDGWLRDILVFTWDNRSLEGHDKIRKYLANTLSVPRISDIKLDEQPGLAPYIGQVTAIHSGVGAAFTFTTDRAHGRGYIRLIRPEGSQEWKALTVFMAMEDLKGHEEEGPELGIYAGHTLDWESVRQSRVEYVEKNAQVLIIGAGQAGLNVGARFKQMNIPAIIVDRTPRVGDVWRNRYPTLTLHSPRSYNQMLYHAYPKTWPKFTPRDKLADWLEQYAISQDLVVWTNSEPLSYPIYDPVSKTWTVHIDRNGKIVKIHPSHIVVAAGTLGAPQIPSIPSMSDFNGTILHSVNYNGAKSFKGKKVVVVGAGNTSADICQDLVFYGAESVTMIQRSSTCVLTSKNVVSTLEHAWPEDEPTEITDFKNASLPYGLFTKIFQAGLSKTCDDHKEMHDGLRKAGLKLNMGLAGAGLLSLVYDRMGGYWIDVGCAELIISGKIKVKQGVEVDHFSNDAVFFTDGSSLDANVVIFATGYHPIRETMRDLFADEVIDKTSQVWGMDEEGETRGAYRPSGYPGLWFATGSFAYSRFYSKRMALEIKAIELGLRA